MQRLLTHHVRFGLLLASAYVALSWAVRVDTPAGRQNASLVYPLDTFSMYSGMPEPVQTALLLRDSAGTVHRVDAFSAFACDAQPLPPFPLCHAPIRIGHKGEELLRHMRQNARPLASGEAVTLLARSWHLQLGALPEWTEDCVLAHCVVLP